MNKLTKNVPKMVQNRPKLSILRKRLFTGRLSGYKKYLTGRLPGYKKTLTDRLSGYKKYLTGRLYLDIKSTSQIHYLDIKITSQVQFVGKFIHIDSKSAQLVSIIFVPYLRNFLLKILEI